MPSTDSSTMDNNEVHYSLTQEETKMIRAVLCSVDEFNPDFERVVGEFGLGKGGNVWKDFRSTLRSLGLEWDNKQVKVAAPPELPSQTPVVTSTPVRKSTANVPAAGAKASVQTGVSDKAKKVIKPAKAKDITEGATGSKNTEGRAEAAIVAPSTKTKATDARKNTNSKKKAAESKGEEVQVVEPEAGKKEAKPQASRGRKKTEPAPVVDDGRRVASLDAWVAFEDNLLRK